MEQSGDGGNDVLGFENAMVYHGTVGFHFLPKVLVKVDLVDLVDGLKIGQS